MVSLPALLAEAPTFLISCSCLWSRVIAFFPPHSFSDMEGRYGCRYEWELRWGTAIHIEQSGWNGKI